MRNKKNARYLAMFPSVFLPFALFVGGVALGLEVPDIVHPGLPLVINTVKQNYGLPSIKEYRDCYETLEKCKTRCQNTNNTISCLSECPICPELKESGFVVQGYNDTDLKVANTLEHNTTNIIRVTNQIQNVITTNMGNVTSLNENNILIKNTNSTLNAFDGDKAGLESCCWVVRKRNCQQNGCKLKKRRQCGDFCEAPIMYAKRLRRCTEGKCEQTVIYKPYTKRPLSSTKCRYTPNWPYLLCGDLLQAQCRRCLRIPYFYILVNGMPRNCFHCFNRYFGGPYSPDWNTGNFGSDREPDTPSLFDDNVDDDWRLEISKCRDVDGNLISENCEEYSGRERTDTSDVAKRRKNSKSMRKLKSQLNKMNVF